MTITDVLDKQGVRYWTSGKNISRGWVGTKCVFCYDSSTHLGINLKDGHYHCWKCSAYGDFPWLLKKLGIPGGIAKEIALQLKLEASTRVSDEHHEPNVTLPKLLQEFTSPLPQRYRDYLEGRNFDPDLMSRKYNLMAAGHSGKYKFRLIVPVVMDNMTVGFIGRDISSKASIKYLLSDDSMNLLPRRSWLFNAESVSKTNGVAVLVEGTFDSFRLGDGAIALLSTQFSKEQVQKVLSLKLKKCYAMFDGEHNAIKKAYELAYYLAPFMSVEVIEMDEGRDPGDLTEAEVSNLRRELF